MKGTDPTSSPDDLPSPWLDLAVRLTLILGLVIWSFFIIRPFVSPMIWGSVLAVTMYPLYERTCSLLGHRKKTVAVSFVVVPLLIFSLPVVFITEALVDDVMALNHAYQSGESFVPAPDPNLESLPLIGKRLFNLWNSAHQDLSSTIERLTPQLLELRQSIVAFARGTAMAMIKLLFSLIVMAVLLVTSEQAGRTTRGMSVRIAGRRGDQLVSLARDTTRSVAKGIVGVAFIQSFLGGLGCLVAGVPMTGLWTVAMLILAVAQISPTLVLAPIAIYLFRESSTPVAVVFTIWSILVGLIDNVLKPLWMGSGVAAPMLVVFLGAIGGMISTGFLGLFVGPVVLVVTFTLIRAWAQLAPEPDEPKEPPLPIAPVAPEAARTNEP